VVSRRILTSLVAACLIVAACGGSSGTPTGSATHVTGSSSATSSAAPTTDDSSPTRTPRPTASPAGSNATARPTGSAGPPAPTGSPAATGEPTGEKPQGSLTWTRIDAGPGPRPREDHTWTVDGDGDAAYLFGGRSSGEVYGDLWRYDLAADSWSRLEPAGSSPAARFGHTATWVDGIGVVIWSGQAGEDFFDDLWAYDPGEDAWRELPGGGDRPAPRYGSCAALASERLLVSHGFTDEGRFDDTRAYDLATATWTDVTPSGGRPVERCLHDCISTTDGRFVLFGGQTNGVPALGDLWTLGPDGAWAEAPSEPGPRPRQLFALASHGGEAFVFGGAGESGGKLDDLWRLDLTGLSWARSRPAGRGPTGRSGATLVADGARSRLLLYGGVTLDGTVDDLWTLEGLTGS
jgi:hypothetical protein